MNYSVDQLEDLAFRGEPVPEDIRSQAELLLFLSFRNLYDFAFRVGMAPEQGKREKAEILEAYRINRFLEDLQEDTNHLWARIEKASADYAHNPTLDTADALYKAIYRVERKSVEKGVLWP